MNRLCRTKFFFSARYLWTAEQMASPGSTMAQGIRADVAEPPLWMRQLIERPLVENKIVKARIHHLVRAIMISFTYYFCRAGSMGQRICDEHLP